MMSQPADTTARPLNLAEYYFLACLDDAGKFVAPQHTIRIGLAGAVITELARRGCLYVTQQLVIVNTQWSGTLEEPLQAVLQIMRQAPENQDAEQWINRFSRPALLDAVQRALEARGEIVVSTRRFLGLIPRTRFLTEHSYSATDMYVRLRAVLLGRDMALDASTWPLTQLLYSTNVLSRVFPGLQHKAVETLLQQYHAAAADDEPAAAEALQAVENAIAEALTATRGQATGMRG